MVRPHRKRWWFLPNLGVGVTQINFASTNGTAIAVDMGTGSGSNFVVTVTFTPGVSLLLLLLAHNSQ